MAYKIIAERCAGCFACLPECPNKAIKETIGTFAIDPNKCTECIGFFDSPQCVAACPIPGVVTLDEVFPRIQPA